MPKKGPIQPEGPLLLTLPRDEAARRIEERLAKGAQLRDHNVSSESDLETLRSEYYTWTEYNQEMLRQMFTTSKLADEYSLHGAFGVGPLSFHQEVASTHNDISHAMRILESIRGRLELIPQAPGVPSAVKQQPQNNSTDVFIVHGRDESVRESVARFVSKLDLNPVVLHEQASRGRTIVEKLEAHSEVGFAIVLLTPDDVGGSGDDGATLRPRARQNVVLELGYFLGRLPRNRVCAIHKGDDLELPSDYMGVIYIAYDSGGGWKLELASYFLVQKSRLKTAWNGFEWWRSVAGRIVFWPKGQKVLD